MRVRRRPSDQPMTFRLIDYLCARCGFSAAAEAVVTSVLLLAVAGCVNAGRGNFQGTWIFKDSPSGGLIRTYLSDRTCEIYSLTGFDGVTLPCTYEVSGSTLTVSGSNEQDSLEMCCQGGNAGYVSLWSADAYSHPTMSVLSDTRPNATLKRTVAGGARLRSLSALFAPARPQPALTPSRSIPGSLLSA